MRYCPAISRLLLLMAAFGASNAGAQPAPPAAAGNAAASNAAAGNAAAEQLPSVPCAQPCAPAGVLRDPAAASTPARTRSVRRRSVQQVIERMPPSQPIAPGGYGPTLTPALPPASAQPVAPPPPVQVHACIGGLCADTSGALYHSGVGNATINSEGRLCNRSGTTMQCF